MKLSWFEKYLVASAFGLGDSFVIGTIIGIVIVAIIILAVIGIVF